MKQKLLLFFTLLMCICLWSGVTMAHSAEWLNRQVNLSDIKTVYIDDDVKVADKVNISALNLMAAKENVAKQDKMLKRFKLTDDLEKADAVVEVTILENRINQYKVPESKETVYEKIIMKDKDGKESSVSVPVTKTVPGYTVYSNYFSVQYLLKLKDGTKVYEYIDTREADKYFSNMFRRATKDFYRNLNKIAKNKAVK